MVQKPLKYNKNYLTNVIFRLDYSPIPELNENISPELRNIIEDNFPVDKKGEGFVQNINMILIINVQFLKAA